MIYCLTAIFSSLSILIWIQRTDNFPSPSLSLFHVLSPPVCAESVRDAVGRKVKLSLRRRVKLEIKGDKTENRVLVSQLLLLSSYFFIKGSEIFLSFCPTFLCSWNVPFSFKNIRTSLLASHIHTRNTFVILTVSVTLLHCRSVFSFVEPASS